MAPLTLIWTTTDRSRHFLIPDDAPLSSGSLVLRTATGREQSVAEADASPFEVTAEEAQAWAKQELDVAFTELRGNAHELVQRLRARTEKLREQNRKTWDEGVANAPPELRDAAERMRSQLRNLGQALQRAARERGGVGEKPADATNPPPNDSDAAS